MKIVPTQGKTTNFFEHMNAPLLTVLIPVYNVAPYIRRAMDSVINQTYHNLEIICVDDGSTDGSLEILREYEAQDSRIRIFSQANAGVAAARNVALDAAKGEWVVGMDPDDWLVPHAYETAVQAIREDVDLVCFGISVLTEGGSGLEGGTQSLQRYYDSAPTGFLKLSDENLSKLNYTIWSKLYRRSVIEENSLRFDEDLRSGSDMCFNVCFYPYARNAFFITERLYCYMLRPGSITFTQTTEQKDRYSRMCFLCMQKLIGFYLDRGLASQYPVYLKHILGYSGMVLLDRSRRGGTQKKWLEAYGKRMMELQQDSRMPKLEGLRKRLSARCRSLRIKKAVVAVLSCLTAGKFKKKLDEKKSLYTRLIQDLQICLDAWTPCKQ